MKWWNGETRKMKTGAMVTTRQHFLSIWYKRHKQDNVVWLVTFSVTLSHFTDISILSFHWNCGISEKQKTIFHSFLCIISNYSYFQHILCFSLLFFAILFDFFLRSSFRSSCAISIFLQSIYFRGAIFKCSELSLYDCSRLKHTIKLTPFPI